MDGGCVRGGGGPYVGVVFLLLGEVLVGVGHGDAHVELREGDLDASLGVGLDGSNLLIQGGGLGSREMGLHSHAVDADALILEHLDKPDHTVDLGSGPLNVVVVVVQLGVGVDLGGQAEGQLDVLVAEDLVEDGLTPGAVLVEGLVDDVPGVALALPVPGDVLDVRGDGGGQVLGGPGGLLDPGGELGVPDQGVAAEDLALLAGEVGGDVALCVVEEALLRFGEEPLRTSIPTLAMRRQLTPVF